MQGVIAHTSRLSADSDDTEETAEPQTKPKQNKAQYLVKMQKAVLDSVSTRFGVNGWVGEDVKKMCSMAVHAVPLGSDNSIMMGALIKAYRNVWSSMSWSGSYESTFEKLFRNGLNHVM